MATRQPVNRPLAVVLGVAYAVAIGLILLRAVEEQRKLLRNRRRRKGPLARLRR